MYLLSDLFLCFAFHFWLVVPVYFESDIGGKFTVECITWNNKYITAVSNSSLMNRIENKQCMIPNATEK